MVLVESGAKLAPIFAKGFGRKVTKKEKNVVTVDVEMEPTRKATKLAPIFLRRSDKSSESESGKEPSPVKPVSIRKSKRKSKTSNDVLDNSNSKKLKAKLEVIEIDDDPFNLNEDTMDSSESKSGPVHPIEPIVLPLAWTEKFKPRSISEVIGHQIVAFELKTWLMDWHEKRRSWLQANKAEDSDNDEEIDMNSCVVLHGEPGIGKTSLVYAVAKECNTKVFEMNCSSKRSGKVVTETLMEATQSHHLGRVSLEESGLQPAGNILNFFSRCKSATPPSKKRKKNNGTADDVPQVLKSYMENSLNVTSNSLILFDDVDLIFEEDDSFWRSVRTLIVETKKPVVFTTTQFLPQTLKQLENLDYIVHRLTVPENSEVNNHMRSISDSEGLIVSDEEIQKIADTHPGDLRRCISELQFSTMNRLSHVIDSKKEEGKVVITEKPDSIAEKLAKYETTMLCDELEKTFRFIGQGSQRQLLMDSRPLPFDDYTKEMELAFEMSEFISRKTLPTQKVSPNRTYQGLKTVIERRVSNDITVHLSERDYSIDYLPFMSIMSCEQDSVTKSETRRLRRSLHYLDQISIHLEVHQKLELNALYNLFS
ncbi:ATPase family AAA domain-containing protein 5 [Halotydeus destructor]|nr:ATPase family AAA domain-containing protein 5 [Halotydeus destructor]